jgi:hypothetical protein
MSETSEKPQRRVIDDANQVMMLLQDLRGREIYWSPKTDSWHYTYSGNDRHFIAQGVVELLVTSGALQPSYVGARDCFGLGPTLDVEASYEFSAKAGRTMLVYADKAAPAAAKKTNMRRDILTP